MNCPYGLCFGCSLVVILPYRAMVALLQTNSFVFTKAFADNECSCTNDQQQSQYIEDVMGLFLVFELCENNCQERVDSIVSTLKERYSHTLSSASDLIEEREQLLRQLMKYQLEAKSNSSSLPYLTPICTYIQHSFWDPIQAYKY